MKINRRSALKEFTMKSAGGAAVLPVAGRARIASEARSEKEAETDVLVCGAGPSGIAAAWMAARAGCRTLLLERSGRLGGMAVQAMVSPLMGEVKSAWVNHILEQIGGRQVDFEFIDLKYARLLQQAGCRILLHAWAVEPLMEGRRVCGVRVLTKEGWSRWKSRVAVDATGDGDIAFRAGAAFDQGRGKGLSWEADGQVQPATIMFRIAGVNPAETMEGQPGGRGRYRFPDGRSWNQFCKDAHDRGELPPTVGMVRTYTGFRPDERVINATQVNGINGLLAEDLTRGELEARRQVQTILTFLRRNAPGFQKAYVNGMPAVLGIRETRRIRGVETLEVADLVAGRRWERAVVRQAKFSIDIHNPAGIGQAQGVSRENPLGKDPEVRPYDIPYGCLVPKEVDGLLVSGRCISGSHEAMASYRVQVIAMATGIAAGVAAALAAGKGMEPRSVPAAGIQNVVFAEAVGPS